MPNEERALGGRAERAAAPRLAPALWLLQAPLSGLGSSPWLSQGVAPPRRSRHGAGITHGVPTRGHRGPPTSAEPQAVPGRRFPLKCWEWPEQPGSLLMINAKSGIEQWCNTVNINYYFSTQPASAPSSRQFHKFRYGVNARFCRLVFQSVLCSKRR